MKTTRVSRDQRSKKGFTLAELTVALLMVTLITGMVITFTVLINAHTKKSSQTLDLQQELEMADMMVRHWVAYFDTAEYGFEMEGNSIRAYLKEDPTKNYTVWLEDGKLHASYPDGVPRYTAIGHIQSVAFLMVNEEGMGDLEMKGELIRCDFTYIVPSANENIVKTDKHTFLISTRISHS